MSLIYNNYGNPTSGQDGGIRSVFVDGEDAGTLVFPIVKYDFQRGGGVFLDLEKGTHTITITYNRDDWYDTNMTTARGTRKNSVSYDSLSLQYIESSEVREKLDQKAAEAKTELIGYKNAEDYRTEQKQELLQEIAAGHAEIEEAESLDEVAAALEKAKAAIDKIKTDAQLKEEEAEAALEGVRKEAVEELTGYKNADDYRAEQKAELQKAIEDGKKAIEAAKDKSEISTALAAAKAVIDKIKTDVQLKEEEAAAALKTVRESAVKALMDYKKPDAYRTEQKAELQKAIADGIAAIEAAKDENAVQSALAAAKAVIDIIKTDAQLTQEEQAKPPVQNPSDNMPAVGTRKKVGKLWYQIITSAKNSRTVKVIKLVKKNGTSVTVPASVKIDGYVYKVTAIGKNAFSGNKKLTKVSIGKNITKIEKKAFNGCEKLKKITIKSSVLKKVGKNAFTGIAKNAKIKVPKKKLANYKKLLKNAKLAKSVKIVK